MSYLIKRIFENKTARILFYFYFIIIILTSFFIVFNYFNQKKQIAETVHTKLWSIVKSVSCQISGDRLDYLLKLKPNKDDITKYSEDSLYLSIQMVLERVESVQMLENPLYILHFDETENLFKYVVRSDKKTYYLHKYTKFPNELKAHYEKGGFLPIYETENGMWLSAFEPLKNKNGRVIGVIEADVNAKEYFQKVKIEFLWTLFCSIIGVLVITLTMLPVIRKILKRDEEYINEITFQKETIEAYSNEVQASSRYASNIQKALVRGIENKGVIKNVEFLNQPRDIVSGDFRWSYETEEFVYFSIGDCTGHGIPGAVLSVIGATILNSLFENSIDKTPVEILKKLDEQFSDYINLSSNQLSMDGMDICVLRLNKKNNELMFSGALQNLICFQNNELIIVKGCRFPVGSANFYPKKVFVNHNLVLTGKLDFFIYTDGFQDQFGGNKGKKLGNKNFLEILKKSLIYNGKSRIGFIEKQVEAYQMKEYQIDDRLLMALEVEIFA